MDLMPDHYFNRITDIPLSFFQKHGINGLILDIDNTLAYDNQNEISDEVAAWLKKITKANISAVTVSNNKHSRGYEFSKICFLPFVSDAFKPSQKTVPVVLDILRTRLDSTAVIGDQIFTDIWYGKRAGCMTILVEKMGKDIPPFVKLKRLFEIPLMKRIRERGVTELDE